MNVLMAKDPLRVSSESQSRGWRSGPRKRVSRNPSEALRLLSLGHRATLNRYSALKQHYVSGPYQLTAQQATSYKLLSVNLIERRSELSGL